MVSNQSINESQCFKENSPLIGSLLLYKHWPLKTSKHPILTHLCTFSVSVFSDSEDGPKTFFGTTVLDVETGDVLTPFISGWALVVSEGTVITPAIWDGILSDTLLLMRWGGEAAAGTLFSDRSDFSSDSYWGKQIVTSINQGLLNSWHLCAIQLSGPIWKWWHLNWQELVIIVLLSVPVFGIL